METRCKGLLVVLVFALLAQACAPLRPETFGPGDIIGVADGMSIALESAQVRGSTLTAGFRIDNSHGTRDQEIRSAVNFSAKDAAGSALDLVPCDGDSMDGTVLAGDQRRGQVCWNVGSAGAKVRISFTLPSGETVTWEVN